MSTGSREVCLGAVAVLAALVIAAPADAQVSLGGFISQFGGPGSAPGEFNSPAGIAVDPADGSLYVADAGNNRIEKFSASGTFQTQLGCATGGCSAGAGNGQFNAPSAVAIDPADGSVYVVDRGNNRVEKFTRNGAYLSQFGSGGAGPGQFSQPRAVAVDPSDGNVWIADGQNNRVEQFGSNGSYLSQFGTLGHGNGQFTGIYGVAVDPSDGSVWASDSTNRVQRFDTTGTYQAQVGSTGIGPGQLTTPDAIAVDPSDGALLVDDFGNDRVMAFGRDGSYIAQLGSTGTGSGQFSRLAGIAVDPSSGSFYTIDSNRVEHFRWPGAFVETFGSSGSGPGRFNNPVGVAVDPLDRSVFVADANGNRVERFTSDGVFSAQLGCASGACAGGTGQGAFSSPIEVSATSSHIFVTDSGNDRVEEFDQSGGFVTAFGSSGTTAGQFNQPVGVAADASDNVFVTDYGGNRVEAFTNASTFQSQIGCVGTSACPTGTISGTFHGPTSVALDQSTGDIYVADSLNNRVEKFSSGSFLWQVGCASGACSAGSGPGQFNDPTRVAVDPADGSLYVVDTGNSRIERFTSSGVYQGSFGMTGPGLGQFTTPRGIGVDPQDGSVYVADSFTNYVQKLGLPSPVSCTGANLSTTRNTPIVLTLNCLAPSGFNSFERIASGPFDGTVTGFNPYTGQLIYRPAAGFTGNDAITFTGADPAGTTPSQTVSIDVTAPPSTPGRPSASKLSLTGVAKGKPKLSFKLTAGSRAPKLKSMAISLPAGLSFSHDKRKLARGIKLGAHAKFTSKLSHGRLTLTLKSSARSVSVTISAPALSAGQSLVKRVRHHKAGRLRFTFRLTDAARTGTTLRPSVSPR